MPERAASGCRDVLPSHWLQHLVVPRGAVVPDASLTQEHPVTSDTLQASFNSAPWDATTRVPTPYMAHRPGSMRAAKAQGRADLHLSTIGVCVPVALSGEVGVQPRNNLLALRESGHQDAARHSRGHISSRNNQHTHTHTSPSVQARHGAIHCHRRWVLVQQATRTPQRAALGTTAQFA